MARARIKLKGKVTKFNVCVKKKLKGKKFKTRAKQIAGFKKATKACAKRH